MHASAVIIALAGLVAADKVHFQVMKSNIGDFRSLALRASGTCTVGTACADSCISIGSTCCSNTIGSYCEVGYRCVTDGCCPIGKTCNGPPVGGCDKGRVECGNYCIPAGSDCCSKTSGRFCDAGTTCIGTSKCSGPQGSGSGGSGGSGSGATTSDIFAGETQTTAGPTNLNTYSLSPAPTTAGDSGSSGSGSNSGDSTTTGSGASPTGDGKQNHPPPPGNAGAINGPNVLIGLLAAAPLLL